MKSNKYLNILYEALLVKRLPRTGFQVLGNGDERLGEHLFLTAVISYIISKSEKVNLEKILLMSIFHDFHESRTGDLHKLAKKYVKRNEKQANYDIFANSLPEIYGILEEYESKKSRESQIVYEANILALILVLKQLHETGDTNVKSWFANKDRLKLKKSKELAEEILSGNTQDWWNEIKSKLHSEYK